MLKEGNEFGKFDNGFVPGKEEVTGSRKKKVA